MEEFQDEVRKIAVTARLPEEEELKKRLESRKGEVEVITDGYDSI